MKTAVVKRWFDWSMYGQTFFHCAMVAKSPRSLDELVTLWLAVADRSGIRTIVHGAFRTVLEMMLKHGQLRAETVDGRCIIHKAGPLDPPDEWMAAEITVCESNAAGEVRRNAVTSTVLLADESGEPERCCECGGQTVGEQCEQCGADLCAGCFEGGCGNCSRCNKGK